MLCGAVCEPGCAFVVWSQWEGSFCAVHCFGKDLTVGKMEFRQTGQSKAGGTPATGGHWAGWPAAARWQQLEQGSSSQVAGAGWLKPGQGSSPVAAAWARVAAAGSWAG